MHLMLADAAGAVETAKSIAPLFSLNSAVALLTLTLMEIVLGIDNIVFIAILSAKLPPEQRQKARRLGLLAAMIMRVGLLFLISWLASLTTPWIAFPIFGFDVSLSGRDLILLSGGLFLIYKATHEIHNKLEGEHEHGTTGKVVVTLGSVIAQIMVMDIIFSIDSVITAVGMADHIQVMVAAVVISVGVMMAFARPLSEFVERHPTIKMLALSFLLLIGVMLVMEGLDSELGHRPLKGYIYFAMGFSIFVEMLNLRSQRKAAKKARPVELRTPHLPDANGG